MPIVVLLSNTRIEMYPGDHLPPHFHLRGPNSTAMIGLETLAVLRGRADRRDLAEALAWCRANRQLLDAEWRRLNEHR